MPKTITVEVPEWMDGRDIYAWIAEGMSREFFKKVVMERLRKGMDLDPEEALSEFEKTREEAWKEIKKKYVEKGLIK